MKLAVTGVTGFVGRNLLLALAGQSWQVKVLARDPSKVPPAANVTVVTGDVSDHVALAQLCADCEVVLHVAGAINGTVAHMMRVNGEGARNIVAAAAEAGTRRFILVSSLAAREPDRSAYGASKRAGEDAVTLAPRQIKTLILRPPAVYGEGDEATLPLLKMLMSNTSLIPGTATARFSLLHVEDLAHILIAAVTSPIEGLREVDDGHGGRTWEEIAQVTRGLFGRPARIFYIPQSVAFAVGHAMDLLAKATGKSGMISADKMRQLYHPDWTAKPPGWPRNNPISLAQGMRRALLWSMDKGLLPRLQPIDRNPTS